MTPEIDIIYKLIVNKEYDEYVNLIKNSPDVRNLIIKIFDIKNERNGLDKDNGKQEFKKSVMNDLPFTRDFALFLREI